MTGAAGTTAAPASGAGRPVGPGRSAVVIGGLPGAGKTTLLSALLTEDLPGVVALDSEQVAARFRAAAPRLPYGVLRPAVHAWHRLRVDRALRGAAAVVVVTDPLTSRRRRAALLRAARRAGRRVRVVLVDASPAEALDGQSARGRALSGAAMRRHTDRWARFRAVVDRAGGVPGADETLVLERAGVRRIGAAAVLGPDPHGRGPAAGPPSRGLRPTRR